MQIEKGIPIPPVTNTYSIYPLKEMEVGDSFVVSLDELEKVLYYIKKFSKRSNAKFTRKKSGLTVRFWRIK